MRSKLRFFFVFALLQAVLCIAPQALAAQIVIQSGLNDPKAPVAKGVEISGITWICKGGETTLKVEGDYESFEWNNGVTGRFLKVKEEGIYEVTVKTKGGCTITSSVNVQIRPCT
jgi:hypothetical protein